MKIDCVKDDTISKNIISHGVYEKTNIELITSVLDKIERPVFLDIGANIGNHAVPISQHVRKLFAFEPVPFTYSIFTKNIEQNFIKNIQPFNVAISNKTTKSTIKFNTSGNIGASTLENHPETQRYEAIQVVSCIWG